MSKRVVYNPIFQHIQGKYSLKDEDGHATPITFKEMAASGRKTLQIGESRKSYLNQLPYSQKELDHQAKFKVAQANAIAALKDDNLKSAFADEFKAALTAGTTEATTLRGFTFTKYYADPTYVPTPAPAGSGTTGTNPNRQYTISVTSANTDQGTVSGGGTFSEGSRITVTATPKSGYTFDHWSDGSTLATRSIQVSQNLTLTASFKTATSGGGSTESGDGENYV